MSILLVPHIYILSKGVLICVLVTQSCDFTNTFAAVPMPGAVPVPVPLPGAVPDIPRKLNLIKFEVD